MKHAIVILDGASGWPLDELGGRTTLEAAHTPNLDALAADGVVGLARTVPEGAEPSSSAACMAILGYDPVADHVGRGAIEAASMGIELWPREVALRVNLVNIAEGNMASYSCGHIGTEEARRIVADLKAALDDDTFTFYPGVAYRHILVVRGHPELLDVRYTPPHDISDKPVLGKTPQGPGAETLLGLMERARRVLSTSEANRERGRRGDVPATDIWPFWPGKRLAGLASFAEARGLRAAMTSGVDLLNGLAALTGITRLDIPGVTDGHDNDYAAQAEGGIAALADHDLVVIHVESPDEEGHAGDAEGKVAAIEAIDREVVSRVRAAAERFPDGLRVLAMPDHPTPVALKTHVAEPVPFVMAGPGLGGSGARGLTESQAASTGLLVDPGHDLIGRFLA